MIARLYLAFLLWQAQRAYRLNRQRAAYHDRAKVTHRSASAEYRRQAYHYEAECARLRRLLIERPLANRVEA